jgi:small-conductance mechanosensitive channel
MVQQRRPRLRQLINRPGRGALPSSREALQALEARIKPDFRRAVVAGLVALVCLGFGAHLGGISRTDHWRYFVIGVTVGFGLFGVLAVRSAAREIGRISVAKAGISAATLLRTLSSVVGYLLVLLGVLQLLDVNLGSLLIGGAVTGVVVGIAAQQSLGNFFAGLVLLFARPYLPGQRVKVRTGALGGPFEGVITEAGLMYTTILTDEGLVHLPNAGLLAAAVGPAPEVAEPTAAEPRPALPGPETPGS